MQAQNRQRGNALAAAGFADNAQRFALAKVEADIVDRGDPAGIAAELDREIVDFEQMAHVSTFRRGSSTSRRPSPSRFMPSVARLIAIPGNSMIHHACTEWSRPSEMMLPQLGVGGDGPTPRKLSAASARMA